MEPEQPSPPDKIRMVLEFDIPTKSIQVNGPIHDQMLCYGLLKLAEKAIDNFVAESKKRGILPVTGNGLTDLLRRRG